MAQLKIESQGIEVPDGEPISKACDELGVPFGCNEGLCGACEVEIVEGMDNLSKRTDNEKDMGVEGQKRLACQCKIKSGVVKIKIV